MKCAECGVETGGRVFCHLDYALIMKELGYDNETIRAVFRLY
jgi:hypothetical protein